MSEATPLALNITEDDLSGGGNYDDFVEGDYVGVLTAVKDAKANSGNVGWKWVYQVNGLDFDIVTWLKGGGIWKLQEVITSMGGELKAGDGQMVDPNMYIGSKAGLKIGKDANQKDPKYADRLTILRTFPVPDQTSIFDIPDTF